MGRGSHPGPGSRLGALHDAIHTLQTGPVDEETFLKASVEGKMKVIEKFLADGGSPDTCDQVMFPPAPAFLSQRSPPTPPTCGPVGEQALGVL